MKAAILKWAAEDIRQMIRMNDSKQYLTVLHQRGSVGDDIWKRFTMSEKFLQLELEDIRREAEAIHPNWTQQLFQTASEIAQNEGLRKRINEFPAQQQEYRQAFEALRENSIKELTSEKN
ncbi:Sec63 complex subunit SEC66 [Sugiyamaella lignohabitans]|uniref:Sec63 complex subunit SEC66 n=1 Tax=Sugiyamaella lignohabitans TaxID=796027 RepID=A0A161HL35_9ASCO|nr:Sec63 complex subunit SEC66 [Sugiyamaella lignohabitans]ANB13917.1 Sec63 complex subunit SEC66 [Sugiyamaella lignohabitans]